MGVLEVSVMTERMHVDGRAERVETAGGLLQMQRRWGALDGVLYLPRVKFQPDDAHVYCMADGERVWSTRHADFPDVVTLLSTDAESLAQTTRSAEGFRPVSLSGEALTAVVRGSTGLLLDGPPHQARRWLLRDWDSSAPESARVFRGPFPAAEVVDVARLVSSRLVAQREREHEDGFVVGVGEFDGQDCIALHDAVDEPTREQAKSQGAIYRGAHPADVLQLQRNAQIVLRGDLLWRDPFGVWLLLPPGAAGVSWVRGAEP